MVVSEVSTGKWFRLGSARGSLTFSSEERFLVVVVVAREEWWALSGIMMTRVLLVCADRSLLIGVVTVPLYMEASSLSYSLISSRFVVLLWVLEIYYW